MTEAELRKRIEALERRVKDLERPVDAIATRDPRITRIVSGP